MHLFGLFVRIMASLKFSTSTDRLLPHWDLPLFSVKVEREPRPHIFFPAPLLLPFFMNPLGNAWLVDLLLLYSPSHISTFSLPGIAHTWWDAVFSHFSFMDELQHLEIRLTHIKIEQEVRCLYTFYSHAQPCSPSASYIRVAYNQ